MRVVSFFDSPIGRLQVVSIDNVLISLNLVETNHSPENQSSEFNDYVIRSLEGYFAGKVKEFNVPYLLDAGTDFQKAVWQAVSQIPYGQTASYSDIANFIKNPNALRAVGTAVGKNPLPIIIPCHRVIKSDGSIGNYAYGEDNKRILLNIEA